jgi:hypothetical protein
VFHHQQVAFIYHGRQGGVACLASGAPYYKALVSDYVN